MRAIVANSYDFYLYNSKNLRFPKKFRNYKIIWDFRDALFEIWEGNLTCLALPKDKIPGYDFEKFIDKLVANGHLEEKPKLEYYQYEILEEK